MHGPTTSEMCVRSSCTNANYTLMHAILGYSRRLWALRSYLCLILLALSETGKRETRRRKKKLPVITVHRTNTFRTDNFINQFITCCYFHNLKSKIYIEWNKVTELLYDWLIKIHHWIFVKGQQPNLTLLD